MNSASATKRALGYLSGPHPGQVGGLGLESSAGLSLSLHA